MGAASAAAFKFEFAIALRPLRERAVAFARDGSEVRTAEPTAIGTPRCHLARMCDEGSLIKVGYGLYSRQAGPPPPLSAVSTSPAKKYVPRPSNRLPGCASVPDQLPQPCAIGRADRNPLGLPRGRSLVASRCVVNRPSGLEHQAATGTNCELVLSHR